jgi:hypothetical protein
MENFCLTDEYHRPTQSPARWDRDITAPAMEVRAILGMNGFEAIRQVMNNGRVGVFGPTQADQFEVRSFPNRGLEARLFCRAKVEISLVSRSVADWRDTLT